VSALPELDPEFGLRRRDHAREATRTHRRSPGDHGRIVRQFDYLHQPGRKMAGQTRHWPGTRLVRHLPVVVGACLWEEKLAFLNPRKNLVH